MTERQKQFLKEDVNNIIDQQILISQLSNGIGFRETDDMDTYERIYVLKKLIDLEKEKIEAKKRAIREAKNKR